MPRLPFVTRDKLPPEQLAIWDELAAGRERLPPFTEILMYRPPVAALAEHLARSVRLETGLPRAIIELVILAVSRELDCRREWAVHLNQARNAGARDEAIEAIKQRRAPEGLTEEETLLVTYAQDLLRNHRVSDIQFQALREKLGDVGIVDLTALIGFYSMAAAVHNAFQVEPPEDPALQLPT